MLSECNSDVEYHGSFLLLPSLLLLRRLDSMSRLEKLFGELVYSVLRLSIVILEFKSKNLRLRTCDFVNYELPFIHLEKAPVQTVFPEGLDDLVEPVVGPPCPELSSEPPC